MKALRIGSYVRSGQVVIVTLFGIELYCRVGQIVVILSIFRIDCDCDTW